MTSEEFVKRIRTVVYDAAIRAAVSCLETPRGRRPPQAFVELSQWYNQYSPEDQERIRQVVQLSVRIAVFEMLTVLDGNKSIRDTGEPLGRIELRYTAGGHSFLLSDPAHGPLYEIFAVEVPPF